MPRAKRKISEKEFVRGFGHEAIKYLESLPVSERPARIEAFGKSVLSSCDETGPSSPQPLKLRVVWRDPEPVMPAEKDLFSKKPTQKSAPLRKMSFDFFNALPNLFVTSAHVHGDPSDRE
jgi:hypothetical protein